ncbi:MAG: tyrosine-type recombinase/integrase [Mycobacterium leprae]
MLRESARVGPRTAETVVCALRALLRFLHVHGWTTAPLAAAVPSVSQRREGLPRALPVGQLTVLVDSCDRASPVGCRDHAILMLLARLGLRCGEVAGLALDDLDWRAGELVVHGKRSRTDRLPLPCDVGAALAEYLRRARPPGFGRTVFLRSQAPIGPLSSDAVSEVVVRAGRRAGIGPVRAHRLRHTVATELLRGGAGLVEIGQVLRHQSLEVTAVYAKVDRSALSRLAPSWSGGLMSVLGRAVTDYLALRRSLGYKLEAHHRLLSQFVAFLEERQAALITTALALKWATQPAGSVVWWHQRLAVVAGFARHLQASHPGHQVPPTDLLPAKFRRAIPYLYSEDDVTALMRAARGIRSPLKAATYETLIGLLSVTGMRIGEVIGLDRGDVLLPERSSTVRHGKNGRSREVALHPTTVTALDAYARVRDELCPRPMGPSFLVTSSGRRLNRGTVWREFDRLRRCCGLDRETLGRQARIHDFRHSFVLRTLLSWYQEDLDVEARLPLLSTFLGHVHPSERV